MHTQSASSTASARPVTRQITGANLATLSEDDGRAVIDYFIAKANVSTTTRCMFFLPAMPVVIVASWFVCGLTTPYSFLWFISMLVDAGMSIGLVAISLFFFLARGWLRDQTAALKQRGLDVSKLTPEDVDVLYERMLQEVFQDSAFDGVSLESSVNGACIVNVPDAAKQE